MSQDRLCTICARGGSKGVPGKNVRDVAGMPLIAHSITQARDSGLFVAVAVSSDDAAILEAAKAWGADLAIERPPELASDTAAKLPAIVHAIRTAEQALGKTFATLVDLDATSPLRLPEDIAETVRMVEAGEAGNVLTVTPAHRSPYFNMLEQDADGRVRLSKPLPEGVVRRQDAPPCFDMNASIYTWARHPFMDAPYGIDDRTRLYVMPHDRSIDIDDEVDFAIVDFLMRKRKGMS